MSILNVDVKSLEMIAGMKAPVGERNGPNCGITAVAVAANVNFDTAWLFFKRRFHSGRGRWSGGTKKIERLKALDHFNIKYEVKVFRHKVPLWWFGGKKDIMYMITTTHHVQIVKNGFVIDQKGLTPMRNYWGKGKKIIEVIEILG